MPRTAPITIADCRRKTRRLTRVGPDTPCGEYLRRFWQPVILASELGDLPRRLRILGEDLVAFRDKSGAIGLLEPYCPHRGTSLEYGLIDDKGIRCCYHGWLFDVDGTNPRDAGRARRQHAQGSALSRRLSGARIRRAWSSPTWDRRTRNRRSRCSIPMTCRDTNWLPARRRSGTATGCRSRKTAWIRRTSRSCTRFRAAKGSARISRNWPSGTGWRRPVGMVYIDTRRYEDKVWVRVADFILPNIHQFPPNQDPVALRNTLNRPQATTWAVPLDDTHTMQIGYYRAPEGKDPGRGTVFGQDGHRSYEERQRVPGDWDAQVSIHNGMARHGLEHLASTDRGIIMMRNMLRRGIRAVARGRGSRLSAF